MPARVLKTSKRKVTLDARPDRPDLRDRIYMPPLKSLPPECPSPQWIKKYLPAYTKAGLILDQGSEGACTGFGLAGVINYLLYRQSIEARRKPPSRVSTRMLYHLARRYDEWPGEDYEGSSCRGAMKGWFHHGVCSDNLWPYRNNQGEAVFVRPLKDWDADATTRPVGAYYRIMVDAVADLQAAINEVGAIYVSSDVHSGWDKIPDNAKSLPSIPWKEGTKPDGGHAYALMGYDAEGFIIQNSWGPRWGFNGFARLTYGDWLENADDAWVAVMGAPIAARTPTLILSSSRSKKMVTQDLAVGLANGATATAVAMPPRQGVWSAQVAVDHALILGNEGLPDQVNIDDADAAASVERVCYERPKEWLKTPKHGGRRIAIYVHGGLNSLSDGIDRAQVMGPWFEKNGVYPIFVVWQTDYVKSIKDWLEDFIKTQILLSPNRKTLSLFEKASDALDYLLEKAAIIPARPSWSQMKQNAIAASARTGGMAQLGKSLARLKADHADLEINLVGHSAGSIVLGAFFDPMKDNALTARTVSLYAPACTVEFANQKYLPAAQNGIIDAKRTYIDILSNRNERKDSVGPYDKSLLYLVSRALETAHKTPILGMEAVWNPAFDKDNIFAADPPTKPNADVALWRKEWLKLSGKPGVLDADRVVEERPPPGRPAFSIRSDHDCFDNWIDGVELTLQRILGLPSPGKLPTRIASLRGF
jgi:hypothetical protein